MSNNNDKTSYNDLKRHDNLNDGTEDTNHNGRIDGDNGDGINAIESETWTETSPNMIDSDGDTFEDGQEKSWGYNPLSNDTDSDGISDDNEDKNGNGLYEPENGETNAKEIDTDGDGLQDKLELDGWTVVIRYEATGEEKERYTVTSNPREAHSDTDNVNDFDEYKNTTDPNKDDTDGDGKSDYEELMGDFNSSATGIDGEPPEIWHYDCKYKITKTKYLGIKVPSGLEVWMEVGARDIFGLDNIEIFISGLENKKIHTNNDVNVTVEFEWELSGIDEYKRAFFDGFDINVTATDRNNNVGFRNEKLDSIKDIVVAAFLGPLLAIAKFIAELASGIFSWVYDAVTNVFNTLISKVNDLFNTIKEYVTMYLYDLFKSGSSGDSNILTVLELVLGILNHPIMWILLGIETAINVALLLINGIPIVGIVSVIIGLIITILIVILTSDEEGSGENVLTKTIKGLFNTESDEGSKGSVWKTVGLASNWVTLIKVVTLGVALAIGFWKKITGWKPLILLVLLPMVLWSIGLLFKPWDKGAWTLDWLMAWLLTIISGTMWLMGLESSNSILNSFKDPKYKGLINTCLFIEGPIILGSILALWFLPSQYRTEPPNPSPQPDSTPDPEKEYLSTFYITFNSFTSKSTKDADHRPYMPGERPPDFKIKDFSIQTDYRSSIISNSLPYYNCEYEDTSTINWQRSMFLVEVPKEIEISFSVYDEDSLLDEEEDTNTILPKIIIPEDDPIIVYSDDFNGEEIDLSTIKLIFNTEEEKLYLLDSRYKNGMKEITYSSKTLSNNGEYHIYNYDIEGDDGVIYGSINFDIYIENILRR